ncbi:transporter associated domain-containing protein [Salinicola sp. DM10]|uniref:TerC family protein n=1 Tax=Salinicola sp. DM10 TaxID=2815721 RepID=UPI001A8FBF0E|nr:transporter associated domain-containing protein [Salinicola sp. DM10]MCE3027098.1 CBS domain-containing protein [Salinicola sp. DM10]
MMHWFEFSWMLEPAAWAGLLTLVIIEIVLGIDNLVFIAILADKLPPAQRDRARVLGLSLALVMRLVLLAAISWLMGLTRPLFRLFEHGFSGRDLILIGGGLFLIYKATSELHDHLNAATAHQGRNRGHYAAFSVVVAQIVALDAVFSIDSVITAVGMVDHLMVMMIAVIIAVGLMLLASKPLTRFVGEHPTVILLCLGFLLMIGFSLVAEGMGLHIPKGYLYGAIGFSILIELMHEWRRRNEDRAGARLGARRARTADAVMRLISGGDMSLEQRTGEAPRDEGDDADAAVFGADERRMVRGVLSMADKPISAVMTLRRDLDCVDLDEPLSVQQTQLRESTHATLVAIRGGERDAPLGVVHKKRLIDTLLTQAPLALETLVEQPLVLLENTSLVEALRQFQRSGALIAFVVDEFGTLEGVVTLFDILMDIAEEDPQAQGAQAKIRQVSADCYEIDASEDVVDVNQQLPEPLPLGRNYTSLGGLVVDRLETLPYIGARVAIERWQIEVRDVERHRIRRVRLCLAQPE